MMPCIHSAHENIEKLPGDFHLHTVIVPEMLNSVKLCICVCVSVCDRESERGERVALNFINNDSLS